MANEAVDAIVEKIAELSAMDLADLSKAIQEKFGVTAAAPVAVAAAGAAPAAGGAEAEEQTEFEVVLTQHGDKKIQVIKVIREVTSLGLKEAKELVDGAPSKVKDGLSKEEAEGLKSKLEEVGATVEIK